MHENQFLISKQFSICFDVICISTFLAKSAGTTKDVREEFIEMERERNKHLQEYRAKKIKLYEKMVAQQDEMLQLQRRSTEAVELIVAKFPGQSLNSPMSPFSVSPIIKFPNLS